LARRSTRDIGLRVMQLLLFFDGPIEEAHPRFGLRCAKYPVLHCDDRISGLLGKDEQLISGLHGIRLTSESKTNAR
jgi:hypothetical protein